MTTNEKIALGVGITVVAVGGYILWVKVLSPKAREQKLNKQADSAGVSRDGINRHNAKDIGKQTKKNLADINKAEYNNVKSTDFFTDEERRAMAIDQAKKQVV